MSENTELKERMKRLAGSVDERGVWASIEARAGEAGHRARLPKVAGRRRLRVAFIASATVLAVAVVALGTVFVVEHFRHQPSMLVIDDGAGLQPGQPGAGGAQPDASAPNAQPGVDYTNGGQWQKLALTGDGGYVQTLIIDPNDPEVLYAVVQQGLFKTSDGAESWSKILSVSGSCEVAVDPVLSATVYVVSPDAESPQILRSDDGGASWIELDSSILLDSDYQSEYVFGGGGFGPPVADGAIEASEIYLGADSGSWRSVDRGANWSKVTLEEQSQNTSVWWGNILDASPPGLVGKTVTDTKTLVSDTVQVAVADPNDSSLIYAGTMGGVYKSADGGATWKKASAGLTSSVVFNLIPDPASPSILYATTESGIQKSTDGGVSWNLILAGGNFMGNLVDEGNGKGSQSSGSCSMVVAPSAPSTLYAWNGDGVSRSDDGGATWDHRAAQGLLTAADSLPTGFTGLLTRVDVNDPYVVFALADRGLYRSADGGDTWAEVSEPAGAWDILVDPNTPSVLYAVADDGVLKSLDAGATWTTIVPAEAGIYFDLDIDAGDPAKLYVLRLNREDETSCSIVRSSDGGATWENVAFSGLGNHYDQLLFDPRSPDVMYAKTVDHATDVLVMGVYRSMDGGTTWQDITENVITGDDAICLVIGPQDGALYGFSRAGLFKWVPVEMSVPVDQATTQWPVNARGQTYGTSALATSPADEPDLVLAVATNGKVGYILRAEAEAVDGSNVRTPEEALAWQAAHGSETHEIPVYEVDGITQIGVFLIGPGEGTQIPPSTD
jgi:photosystem II stability/assembly factor-like uncharacterized protein